MNKHQISFTIERHMELVHTIAHKIHRTLPSHVMLDDLVQDGMVGLVEAANRYDPALNDSFAAYATPRIRGHIIDGIRKLAPRTRQAVENEREISRAREILEKAVSAPARNAEIALLLGVPAAKVGQILANAESSELLQYDEGESEYRYTSAACRTCQPDTEAESKSDIDRVFAIVRMLPFPQRTVFIGYYFERRRLKDISQTLGVGTARASQIKEELCENIRNGLYQSIV